MRLIERIYEKAKALGGTIVLPEGCEERNLRAMEMITLKGLAKIVLLGNKEEISKSAKSCGVNLSGATVRDPSLDKDRDRFVSELVELRKDKGMTDEKARELLRDPLYFAAMLVKSGQADGYVAGAIHATGDVLKPALQIIKTAPNCKTVSSFFIMVLPESSPYASVRNELFFADCAVVPTPDADELSDIAVSTADSFRSLVSDDEPMVAMLSFSTRHSARHVEVQKVIDATELVRKKAPDLHVDGDLQADAALIAKVADQKCPGSSVAGKANILIFPDLNSGNIAYKLVQRLSGAAAIGPVVQGLAKPVNDLSRGCTAQDIVDTVAVTVCQTSRSQ